jgi:hypothetical protein
MVAYDTVRAAVAAYGARVRAGGAYPGQPDSGGIARGVFTPRVPAVAVWDGARHVARYPGAPYARVMLRLASRCSRAVPIHVYVGGMDDNCRETSHGDGSLADFDPNTPPYIPENSAVYIVWDTWVAGDSASCTATFSQV